DFVAAGFVLAIGQDDIGDHDRAGDRAAARSGARHAHLGVPVDDRFDFLGRNLQAADIDDAAAPADEVVSVPAQFDHVAGVDESVLVGQGGRLPADIGVSGTPRANPQRSVHDFHFNAVTALPDQGGGKAFKAIVHGKADARL